MADPLSVFLSTNRERRVRAEQVRKRHGGHTCGSCGKPIRPSKHSLKCDGWHWHRECWRRFVGGH